MKGLLSPTSGEHSRIYGLDIMRASAIMFVLLGHAEYYIGRCNSNRFFMCYKYLLVDGVSIFFVLSGFLIGGILLKTINKDNFRFRDIGSFWVKRWFRTIPNYMLILLLNIILYIGALKIDPAYYQRLYLYPFFLQSFNWTHPIFFGEAWSLCIEEWFYLLIPFGLFSLVSIAPQYRKQIIFLFIFYVIILITYARIYRLNGHVYNLQWYDDNIRKPVVMRLDSLMYGVLGAFLSFYYNNLFYKYRKSLFFVGLAIVYIPVLLRLHIENYRLVYDLYYSLESIGFLLLLPLLSSVKIGKGWVFNTITFISIISYSLYLTHYSLLMYGILPFVFKWIGLDYSHSLLNAIIALGIYLTSAITISYFLYTYYEKPFMLLREKIEKRKQSKSKIGELNIT